MSGWKPSSNYSRVTCSAFCCSNLGRGFGSVPSRKPTTDWDGRVCCRPMLVVVSVCFSWSWHDLKTLPQYLYDPNSTVSLHADSNTGCRLPSVVYFGVKIYMVCACATPIWSAHVHYFVHFMVKVADGSWDSDLKVRLILNNCTQENTRVRRFSGAPKLLEMSVDGLKYDLGLLIFSKLIWFMKIVTNHSHHR